MFHDPINPLPRKCSKCGFPDLDHVPQPYYLVKSRTLSPNDLALAENGNFLIRERVRRIFDLVAPRLCDYYPTYYLGTVQKTHWLLAVPKQQVVTAKVMPSIPRCKVCKEPQSAHPGSQYSEYLFGTPVPGFPKTANWSNESRHEIFKSANWGSSEYGWGKWMSRDLFLSVRLLHLLKKVKAKGFYEATCGKPLTPDKNEESWITDQLQLLKKEGIPFHAEGTLPEEDTKWFRKYIKTHASKTKKDYDIKPIERRLKAKLPKSYLDFVSEVGAVSFKNIDEQEGFIAKILAPGKLNYGGNYDDLEDEESKAVNGLIFAETEHGDFFCFDVQKGKKEYSVFLYKHEGNFYEPYADNFVACIKRFTGGGDN